MTPNYAEIIPGLNKDLQNVRKIIISEPERIRSDFAGLAVEVSNELSGGHIWEMVPPIIGTLTMSFTVDNASRSMQFRRPGLSESDSSKLLSLPVTAIDEMMIRMIETMALADIQWIPVFTQQPNQA